MSRVIAKFQELSPIRQAAVIAGAAWNIALIVLAQRDLNRRDPSERRGTWGRSASNHANVPIHEP